MKQVTITEHNSHEGETFSYILNLEDELISEIRKGLKKEISFGIIKIEVGTNYKLNEVKKLNKISNNTYMDRFGFYEVVKPKGKFDWYEDIFYKAVGLKEL